MPKKPVMQPSPLLPTPARTGINPATKEKIEIAAKKVVKFKACSEIADAINA